MNKSVPDVDRGSKDRSSRHIEIDAKNKLQHHRLETRHKDLINKEIDQRIKIKATAVKISLFMIVAMLAFLAIMVITELTSLDIDLPLSVVAPPLASATTITVALLIGAFRKYSDGEMEAFGKGVSSATRITGGS